MGINAEYMGSASIKAQSPRQDITVVASPRPVYQPAISHASVPHTGGSYKVQAPAPGVQLIRQSSVASTGSGSGLSGSLKLLPNSGRAATYPAAQGMPQKASTPIAPSSPAITVSFQRVAAPVKLESPQTSNYLPS